MVMAALTGQRDGPRGIGVEPGAEGDQLPERDGALSDQNAHGLVVAEPNPGHERVGQVLLGRVVLGKGRSDAPLGPASRPLVHLRLRDEQDRLSRGSRVQRCRQARHSRADDDDIRARRPARLIGQEPRREGRRRGHAAPTMQAMLSMSLVAPTRTAIKARASPASTGPSPVPVIVR
ncbi:unannotated protein [freshwater metagenome]|uniref:Unannotated protein n=1 Tax=freshwater metagenome TaxID=449393 RepID=A0A6J7E9D9_9ZZZZ